jgi:hypothetical protein
MAPCSLVLLLALVAHTAWLAQGKGAWLARPPARQVVLQGAFLAPADLGSLDGGGPVNEVKNGHDVCGGTNSLPGTTSLLTNMGENGVWGGNLTPQGSYTSGGPIDITVVVDDHQYGHLEFRLCLPAEGEGKVTQTTQSCLNSHVLKFDPVYTAKLQADVTMRPGNDNPGDFAGKENINSNHKRSKCPQRKVAYAVPAAPVGSCCSGADLVQGGKCSPEEANTERWLLPNPIPKKQPNGAIGSEYLMRYILPVGVTCTRCTLQMYYQQGYTAATQVDAYPRGIWNCADVAIVAPPVPAPSKTPLIIGAAVGAAVLVLLVALCVVAWKKGLRCCVIMHDENHVGGGTQHTRRRDGGSKEGDYSDSARNTQQQMESPTIGGRFRDIYQRVSMRSQALMGGGGGSMRADAEQQPERLAAGRGVFLEPMGDALLRSVQGKAKPPPPPGAGGRVPPTPPPPPPPDGDDYDVNPRHSLDV